MDLVVSECVHGMDNLSQLTKAERKGKKRFEFKAEWKDP
jgi:hypothetical protein